MATYPAVWIGARAHDVLRRGGKAVCMGQTSAGTFLQVGDRSIIFVSTLPFRGPYTVNYETSDHRTAWSVSAGDPVTLEPFRQVIVLNGQRVHYAGAVRWQAGPVPAIPPGWEPAAAFREMAQRVLARPEPSAVVRLLDPNDDADGMRPAWNALLAAVRARDNAGMAAALRPFAGRGGGLTPSGDDLAYGLVLAAARWGSRLAPGVDPGDLGRQVAAMAWERTTRLSANLIEAGAEGQADERLLLALDALMANSSSLDDAQQALFRWGHSSGRDAFTGMYAWLLAAGDQPA